MGGTSSDGDSDVNARFLFLLIVLLLSSATLSLAQEFDQNKPQDWLQETNNYQDPQYTDRFVQGVTSGKLSSGAAKGIMSAMPTQFQGKIFELISKQDLVSLNDFKESFTTFAKEGLKLESLTMDLGNIKYDGKFLSNGAQSIPLEFAKGASIETTENGLILKKEGTTLGFEGPTGLDVSQTMDGYALYDGAKTFTVPNGFSVTLDNTPNGGEEAISITDNRRQTTYIVQGAKDAQTLDLNEDGTYSLGYATNFGQYTQRTTVSNGMTVRASFEADGGFVLDSFPGPELKAEPVLVEFFEYDKPVTQGLKQVVLDGRGRYSEVTDPRTGEQFQRLDNAIGYYGSVAQGESQAYITNKVDARDKSVDMYVGSGSKSKEELDAYSNQRRVEGLYDAIKAASNPTAQEEERSFEYISISKDRMMGYISTDSAHSFFRADTKGIFTDNPVTDPLLVTNFVSFGTPDAPPKFSQQAAILNADMRWDSNSESDTLQLQPSVSLGSLQLPDDPNSRLNLVDADYVHFSTPATPTASNWELHDGKLRDTLTVKGQKLYVDGPPKLTDQGTYSLTVKPVNPSVTLDQSTAQLVAPKPASWHGYRHDPELGTVPASLAAANQNLGASPLYTKAQVDYAKSTGTVSGRGGNSETELRFVQGKDGRVHVTKAFINMGGKNVRLAEGRLAVSSQIEGALFNNEGFLDLASRLVQGEDLVSQFGLSLQPERGAVLDIAGAQVFKPEMNLKFDSSTNALKLDASGTTSSFSVDGLVENVQGKIEVKGSLGLDGSTISGTVTGTQGKLSPTAAAFLQAPADLKNFVVSFNQEGVKIDSSGLPNNVPLALSISEGDGLFDPTTLTYSRSAALADYEVGFDEFSFGDAPRGMSISVTNPNLKTDTSQFRAQTVSGTINVFSVDGEADQYIQFDRFTADQLDAAAEQLGAVRNFRAMVSTAQASGLVQRQQLGDDGIITIFNLDEMKLLGTEQDPAVVQFDQTYTDANNQEKVRQVALSTTQLEASGRVQDGTFLNFNNAKGNIDLELRDQTENGFRATRTLSLDDFVAREVRLAAAEGRPIDLRIGEVVRTGQLAMRDRDTGDYLTADEARVRGLTFDGSIATFDNIGGAEKLEVETTVFGTRQRVHFATIDQGRVTVDFDQEQPVIGFSGVDIGPQSSVTIINQKERTEKTYGLDDGVTGFTGQYNGEELEVKAVNVDTIRGELTNGETVLIDDMVIVNDQGFIKINDDVISLENAQIEGITLLGAQKSGSERKKIVDLDDVTITGNVQDVPGQSRPQITADLLQVASTYVATQGEGSVQAQGVEAAFSYDPVTGRTQLGVIETRPGSSSSSPSSASYGLQSGDTAGDAALALGLRAYQYRDLLTEYNGNLMRVGDIPEDDSNRFLTTLPIGKEFFLPNGVTASTAPSQFRGTGASIDGLQVYGSDGKLKGQTGAVTDIAARADITFGDAPTINNLFIPSGTVNDLVVFADGLKATAETVRINEEKGVKIDDLSNAQDLVGLVFDQIQQQVDLPDLPSVGGVLTIKDLILSAEQLDPAGAGELRPIYFDAQTSGFDYYRGDTPVFSLRPNDFDFADMSLVMTEDRVNLDTFNAIGEVSGIPGEGIYKIELGTEDGLTFGSVDVSFANDAGEFTDIVFPEVSGSNIGYDLSTGQIVADTVSAELLLDDTDDTYIAELSNFRFSFDGSVQADTGSFQTGNIEIKARNVQGNVVDLDLIAEIEADEILSDDDDADNKDTSVRLNNDIKIGLFRDSEGELYVRLPTQTLSVDAPIAAEDGFDVNIDQETIYSVTNALGCKGSPGQLVTCFSNALKSGQVVIKRKEADGDYQLFTAVKEDGATNIFTAEKSVIEPESFIDYVRKFFLGVLYDPRGKPLSPEELGGLIDDGIAGSDQRSNTQTNDQPFIDDPAWQDVGDR